MRKIIRLGPRYYSRWSATEHDLLLHSFFDRSRENLLKLLPDRSWGAIEQQAHKLALTRRYQSLCVVKYVPQSSPELSYLIGALRGDGCVIMRGNNRYRISLNATDYDFVYAFNRALCHTIGRTHLYPIGTRQRLGRKIAFVVEGFSQSFVQWYKSTSFDEQNTIVEKYPCQYLRGLYDSEGGVVVRPQKHSQRPTWQLCGKIHFTTTSVNLLNHVRLLLALQDIEPAHISVTKHAGEMSLFPEGSFRNSKTCYQMIIARKASIANFQRLIGFSANRKGNLLEELTQTIESFGTGDTAARVWINRHQNAV